MIPMELEGFAERSKPNYNRMNPNQHQRDGAAIRFKDSSVSEEGLD